MTSAFLTHGIHDARWVSHDTNAKPARKAWVCSRRQCAWTGLQVSLRRHHAFAIINQDIPYRRSARRAHSKITALAGETSSFSDRDRVANNARDHAHDANAGSGAKLAANRDGRSSRKLSLAGILFLIITYIWATILFIPMMIAHPFVLLFDRHARRFHDFIAMAWMRLSVWTVLVSPRIINGHNIPEKGKPVVYVANHLSYLDIFVFAFLYRRIKYVSKAEIFNIPIVGWAMRMAGNIALARTTRRSQMRAYRQMLDILKCNLSLVVFPEGTRSPSGRMRRFKEGAFRAAKQQNVAVVPITILGTRETMPPTAWVPLHYPKVPISIVVHPPIDSSTRTLRQVCDHAFDAIQSALPAHVQSSPEMIAKDTLDSAKNEIAGNESGSAP